MAKERSSETYYEIEDVRFSSVATDRRAWDVADFDAASALYGQLVREAKRGRHIIRCSKVVRGTDGIESMVLLHRTGV